MKSIICDRCGANELIEKNGYLICMYCGSKFLLNGEEHIAHGISYSLNVQGRNDSDIALVEDVQMLLQKCVTDRKNAKRYANLILDIDPDNEEALKYL